MHIYIYIYIYMYIYISIPACFFDSGDLPLPSRSFCRLSCWGHCTMTICLHYLIFIGRSNDSFILSTLRLSRGWVRKDGDLVMETGCSVQCNPHNLKHSYFVVIWLMLAPLRPLSYSRKIFLRYLRLQGLDFERKTSRDRSRRSDLRIDIDRKPWTIGFR